MALEEELMHTEVEESTEEQKDENWLTWEELECLKTLKESAWWEVLLGLIKKRIEAEEKSIISQIKDWFINPSSTWFNVFNVLWGFIQWMWMAERLLNTVTQDPEEVKKAQKIMENAEAILRGEEIDEEK